MQDKPNGQEGMPRDEGAMFQRMLKTRTILLSGEIDKPLAEKVVRQLILLEADERRSRSGCSSTRPEATPMRATPSST